MRNNPLSEALERVESRLKQVAADLRKTPHPPWTQLDPSAQFKAATKAMVKIIHEVFTQTPKLSPFSQLKLPEQIVLHKALRNHAELLAIAAVKLANPSLSSKDQNNRDAFNNKLITAHKFFAATLAAIYRLYDEQANQKKSRKKLLKYLAILEKKQKETEEFKYAQGYQPKQTAKGDKPLIILNLEPNDEELLDMLEMLGFKMGDNYETVSSRLLSLEKEFTPETHPKEYAAVKSLLGMEPQELARRLITLPTLSSEEIVNLAKVLQKEFPGILEKEISLRDIESAFLKFNLNQENGASPFTQKIYLTIQRLKHEFRADPNQKFSLAQRFLEPSAISPFGKVPRPTPRGAPKEH